jgi:hypothetical protein
MTKITNISTEELLKDREDSLKDITICEAALLTNILSYSGGSVEERLNTNKQIVGFIEAELEQRKVKF